MKIMSVNYYKEEEEACVELLELYEDLDDAEKMSCLNDAIFDLTVYKEALKIEMEEFKNDNNEPN
jgi:hypothetical protein